MNEGSVYQEVEIICQFKLLRYCLKKEQALLIARFRVQYDQYFLSFSYFADLFHKPLGE